MKFKRKHRENIALPGAAPNNTKNLGVTPKFTPPNYRL